MRPHPLAAACAAVLLCAALTACSRDGGDPDEAADPTADAAVEPDPGADEASPPPEDETDEEEWPFGTPVGWVDQPLAEESVAEDEDGEDAEDSEADSEGDPADEDPDGGPATEAPDEQADGEDSGPGLTGGAEGETVTATDAGELAEHLSADEPLVVEVEGGIGLDGDVPVASDKTLVGVGDGAELTGGGLVLDGSSNVILANLIMETDGSAISVLGGAHHVWVDGSTFSGGEDGALVSMTDGADHVTLSWNHFTEAASAISVGGRDDDPGALRVTVHHNYFDGTSGRHPRARNAEHVHVFNNYFRANPDYGVESAYGSNVLVEGNYFEGTPLSVSSEEDDPGNVVTRDNLLVDSEQPELRGNVPDPPYDYELDDTVDVPDLVMEQAGTD
ncbi:pectate lyase family protein [Nocardiopsis nanhaiensis]